jgi:AraC-like DNA-binding protein
MIVENACLILQNIPSAAYRVGYHDASHFNREYKSLFGVPPMRDVQRLREEVSAFPGQ